MIFAVIGLLALAAVLLGMLLSRKKSLKAMTKALRRIAQEEGTNAQLTLAAPDKALGALATEINGLLSEKRQMTAEHRRREQELRNQIEGMSHDLRTPLTSVLGYTQLLKDDTLSEEERRACVDIVEKRARSLQALIASFYELSRLEANTYGFEDEAVDLYSLLCEVLAAYYSALEDRGLAVTLDLKKGLPRVRGDAQAINRICVNLIQNVLKHGRDTFEIRQYTEEDRVVTCFTNGTDGLKAEDVASVFDRFFTADRMRTGQNTGLGLAIVKGLAEGMGHRVSAALADGLFTLRIDWQIVKDENKSEQ
ncbi:MAG: HAMP domain-containing sensor histidine kinase [Eubacterium sp.]|nr:HAMP domain-containing sensor histidine kinase [Eubacterium sp.]